MLGLSLTAVTSSASSPSPCTTWPAFRERLGGEREERGGRRGGRRTGREEKREEDREEDREGGGERGQGGEGREEVYSQKCHMYIATCTYPNALSTGCTCSPIHGKSCTCT